jgi:hypothetical protein
MEGDFLPMLAGPRMGGGVFLADVLGGYAVDWANRRISLGDANRVLATLGLLQVRVKCVIPEDYGGYYKLEVSVLL